MADNYVLIGYMGAGKTTVGKQLASKCGKQFADTDAMIVERKRCRLMTFLQNMAKATLEL